MKKILICDDDPSTRKALTVFLQLQGYETTDVDNGIAALKLLFANAYHLVLMDIDMPGLNGIETIKKLRQIKPKQNVIIVTGHKLSDIMAVAYKQLQVYDIVEKPFDLEYLKSIIYECIDSTMK